MPEYDALGLIETRGLAAAIEAADAAVKTAPVRLVGITKTVPALMTVQIAGETAAVRAGVDAACAAVERMGEVVASHVIPRPDEAVALLQGMPEATRSPPSQRKAAAPAARMRQPPTRSGPSENAPDREHLEAMTVRQLRSLARSTPGIGLKGRAIARATKSELLLAFRG